MKREKAIELLQKYVKNDRMIIHSIAAEKVMGALALKLNQDADKWALAGLLHDIDVEVTNADAETHGLEAVNILKSEGIDEEIIDAIMMHNEMAAKKPRNTMFQHALAAGETITGLISATTMVYPDKKISSVKPKSVVKRMKEKNFAASVKRENIMECEKIGLTIDEFAELCVNTMQQHAEELGM